ncbi:MAG: putative glycosyltransferase EpsH [Verrucomicrobiota bacterium]
MSMDAERADVSVIMRTTGRSPAMLARALASVRAQTFPPVALVLVGDGLTGPDLFDLAERCGGAGPAMLEAVALPRAAGRAGAANAGGRRARTEWVAFLDEDDTWAPVCLEELLAYAAPLAGAPDFGAAVCRTEAVYERMGPDGPMELEREPFNPWLEKIDGRALLRGNPFTIHAALWHRRVAGRLGGFREDLAVLEDWEFNARAARDFRLIVKPRVLAFYHLRPPAGEAANSAEVEHDRTARALRAEWAGRGWLTLRTRWAEATGFGAARRRWQRWRARARWRGRLAV